MTNEMELRFPAAAQNEAFARMVISAFIMSLAPTLTETAEIRTAVSEAVTNAVVHAYRGMEGTGDITMRARLTDGLMTVVVEDTGAGIADVARAMEPFYTTQPAEERTGIGFALMQSFMDEVSVVSAPGKGTKVTLTRRITGEAERPRPEEQKESPAEAPGRANGKR